MYLDIGRIKMTLATVNLAFLNLNCLTFQPEGHCFQIGFVWFLCIKEKWWERHCSLGTSPGSGIIGQNLRDRTENSVLVKSCAWLLYEKKVTGTVSEKSIQEVRSIEMNNNKVACVSQMLQESWIPDFHVCLFFKYPCLVRFGGGVGAMDLR